MGVLRSIARDLGFAGATTYLQSGNLVLPGVGSAPVATALTNEIRRVCGLEIPIITRTASEWARVVAGNPFTDATTDGTKLHVLFLEQFATERVRRFDADPFTPEQFAVAESEVYLSLPNGIGRSKLATALTRLDNADTGTTRNWKTVTALADLIED